MSDQKSSDDAKKRLDRLKAMQARHAKRQPAAPAQAPEKPAAKPKAAPAAAAKPGAGIAQSPILQKLRQALSTPDGGIDERKARMLVQFIRTQAQDPDAPRHDMAKRLIEAFQNMDPEKRQKLLGALSKSGLAAKLRGGAPGAKGAAEAPAKGGDAATGEPWFDDLVNGL